MKVGLLNKKSEDDSESLCPKLTFKERIMGFVICSAIGYILSILSTLSLLMGKRDMTKFGITYTLGNLISIVA